MNGSIEQRDLRSYLRPIRTYWWLILAVVVIVTAGTYVYYAQKPKSYEATTEILVQQSPLNQLVIGSSGGAVASVENFALLIQTRAVAEAAAKHLGKKPPSSSASISAAAVGSSNFIEITATGSNPDATARWANAYATGFIANQAAQVRREAKQALAATETQLRQIGSGGSPVEGSSLEGQRAALEEQIRTLELVVAQPVRSTGIRRVESAVPPSAPSSSSPTSNAIFAFVVSLMLGIGAAFGLQYLNRRMTSVEAAEEVFGLPVLTEVPTVDDPAPSDPNGIGMSTMLHEPFHRLQTNLEMLSHERPLRTILIASAAPGEGKSQVARNLALAYSEAGRKVAVIDADFYRGGLGRLFLAGEGPGLTDVLTGRSTFEEAVQAVQVPAVENGNVASQGRRRSARATLAGQGEIAIVPAGSHPSENVPPASNQLRQTLAIVPDAYDTVIIDSAPLLAAADVLPLLSGADGVVLVTRLGSSSRDSATRLLTALKRVPHIHIAGLVVNGIPSRIYRSRAYGYYNGY